VIYDPLISVPIFLGITKKMDEKERYKIASLAITVAAVLSFTVLFIGLELLIFFNTNLNDFKVAGGIILGILGVKMVLGIPIQDSSDDKNKSAKGIAVIIGTPLLTGPAAITSIIISTNNYGLLTTGISIAIVLAICAGLLYGASKVQKFLGNTTIQVTTTMMGLITLAWGVMFVREGLGVVI
jgi:multiple antibiotic resistance protein